MSHRVTYQKDSYRYEATPEFLEPLGISHDDIAPSLEMLSKVVTTLHEFQRNMLIVNIICCFVLTVFLLAVGGAATYLMFFFKQTVYVYLVVLGAVGLLIFFGLLFITAGVRAFVRNRAALDYEDMKNMWKTLSVKQLKEKGVKAELKFEVHTTFFSYSFRPQYPYVEITRLECKDAKTENSALIGKDKRERKKSGKFEDRVRTKSYSSRVADL